MRSIRNWIFPLVFATFTALFAWVTLAKNGPDRDSVAIMVFLASLNWTALIQSLNKRDNRILWLSAGAVLAALLFIELNAANLMQLNSYRLMNMVNILGALLILFYIKVWNR